MTSEEKNRYLKGVFFLKFDFWGNKTQQMPPLDRCRQISSYPYNERPG